MARLCYLTSIRNIFLNSDLNPLDALWLPTCLLWSQTTCSLFLSFFFLVLIVCNDIPFPSLVWNSTTFSVSTHEPYFLNLWLFSLLFCELFPIDPNLPCSAVELPVNLMFVLSYDQDFVNKCDYSTFTGGYSDPRLSELNKSFHNLIQNFSDHHSNFKFIYKANPFL